MGSALAKALIETASHSVGRHHHPAFTAEIRILCEDLDLLRRRIDILTKDLVAQVTDHPVASLLTTIDGIGALTAAQIVAAIGDPSRFRSPAALASYVGAVPATSQSGKDNPGSAPLSRIGSARLRAALWMPTLAAVRRNTWIRAHCLRLTGRGKRPKAALVAAMRRLLVLVHVIAKRGSRFQPDPPRP